ncbi:hypothetical protein LRS74_21275 [Streptomyces sp. LX-29]|uniref:hypothetical protein n=1 Tax=Streptomyces sp. LX-29 TaxID=2900152 RepID=UPI00240DA50B|nr:hypothetical protein [Streptomyces sp. LX-29]WFB09287.1 hypothetical protein LRS74_21275 [Streptomyces sp. LX-29]
MTVVSGGGRVMPQERPEASFRCGGGSIDPQCATCGGTGWIGDQIACPTCNCSGEGA